MIFFGVLVLIAASSVLGGLGIIMIIDGLRQRRENHLDLIGPDWTPPKYTRLSVGEVTRLRTALEQNADDGAALMMDHRTTFTGVTLCEEGEEVQTINRIKSIPMHY